MCSAAGKVNAARIRSETSIHMCSIGGSVLDLSTGNAVEVGITYRIARGCGKIRRLKIARDLSEFKLKHNCKAMKLF